MLRPPGAVAVWQPQSHGRPTRLPVALQQTRSGALWKSVDSLYMRSIHVTVRNGTGNPDLPRYDGCIGQEEDDEVFEARVAIRHSAIRSCTLHEMPCARTAQRSTHG